jgi:hypothetical protein
MNTVQIVIHCIGLLLWTDRVTNDPGLHGIMPRVQASRWVPGAEPRGLDLDTISHYEPHTAMLIYPRAARDNTASNWPAQPFAIDRTLVARLKNYEYIEFKGEHVSFVAGAANPRASIPAQMPRFRCDGASNLAPDYEFPYPSAAAKIDLPEGVMNACYAGYDVAPERIDTTVTLNTAGRLTIVGKIPGTAGTKVLVLKFDQSSTIFLANVPLGRALHGTHHTETGDKHYYAYWAMLGKHKKSSCSGPPRVDEKVMRNEQTRPKPCAQKPLFSPRAPTDPRTLADARRIAQRGTALGGPQPAAAADPKDVLEIITANSECSNTGWP